MKNILHMMTTLNNKKKIHKKKCLNFREVIHIKIPLHINLKLNDITWKSLSIVKQKIKHKYENDIIFGSIVKKKDSFADNTASTFTLSLKQENYLLEIFNRISFMNMARLNIIKIINGDHY